jgi:hypothetical protein
MKLTIILILFLFLVSNGYAQFFDSHHQTIIVQNKAGSCKDCNVTIAGNYVTLDTTQTITGKKQVNADWNFGVSAFTPIGRESDVLTRFAPGKIIRFGEDTTIYAGTNIVHGEWYYGSGVNCESNGWNWFDNNHNVFLTTDTNGFRANVGSLCAPNTQLTMGNNDINLSLGGVNKRINIGTNGNGAIFLGTNETSISGGVFEVKDILQSDDTATFQDKYNSCPSGCDFSLGGNVFSGRPATTDIGFRASSGTGVEMGLALEQTNASSDATKLVYGANNSTFGSIVNSLQGLKQIVDVNNDKNIYTLKLSDNRGLIGGGDQSVFSIDNTGNSNFYRDINFNGNINISQDKNINFGNKFGNNSSSIFSPFPGAMEINAGYQIDLAAPYMSYSASTENQFLGKTTMYYDGTTAFRIKKDITTASLFIANTTDRNIIVDGNFKVTKDLQALQSVSVKQDVNAKRFCFSDNTCMSTAANGLPADTNWQTDWTTFDANMQNYYMDRNRNIDQNVNGIKTFTSSIKGTQDANFNRFCLSNTTDSNQIFYNKNGVLTTDSALSWDYPYPGSGGYGKLNVFGNMAIAGQFSVSALSLDEIDARDGSTAIYMGNGVTGLYSDFGSTLSVDWVNRKLYSNDGATNVLDWSNNSAIKALKDLNIGPSANSNNIVLKANGNASFKGDINARSIQFQNYNVNDWNTASGGLVLIGAKSGIACTTVCANHGLACNQSVTLLGIAGACSLTAADYQCWCE